MKEREVDEEIVLIPYYPNEEVTIKWYQDKDVCKQSDNIDFTYSVERLQSMYNYLNSHGECYYICYNGLLVGDVTLKDDGEICIVVCKEYQNRHIGRRSVKEIINLAKEKGMSSLTAEIYSFNKQSQRMFLKLGFLQIDENKYVYNITNL